MSVHPNVAVLPVSPVPRQITSKTIFKDDIGLPAGDICVDTISQDSDPSDSLLSHDLVWDVRIINYRIGRRNSKSHKCMEARGMTAKVSIL